MLVPRNCAQTDQQIVTDGLPGRMCGPGQLCGRPPDPGIHYPEHLPPPCVESAQNCTIFACEGIETEEHATTSGGVRSVSNGRLNNSGFIKRQRDHATCMYASDRTHLATVETVCAPVLRTRTSKSARRWSQGMHKSPYGLHASATWHLHDAISERPGRCCRYLASASVAHQSTPAVLECAC